MLKRIVCVCVSLVLCILNCACSSGKLCDLSDYTTATVLSDEEYTDIENHISNLEITSPQLNFLSQIGAHHAQPEVIYISEIGIRGIPVLLEVLKELEIQRSNEENSHEENVLIMVKQGIFETSMYTILHSTDYHCGKTFVEDAAPLHKVPEHSSMQGSKAMMSCFFLTAEAEIPKILESDTDIPSKFPKLARFGILAIPYILPEIEKGETEYEKYFTYIGLHLASKDFIKTSISIHYEERWEELQQDENYTKGAEDFDYKEWLDENANDIRALLKYIEEYTQEFKDLV